MTSPVDTSVKYITSSMVGGPVLNGVAGSMLGLLDAFLVDGWGLQTASSVVVAGGVATVTFSSAFPALADSVVLVAGATPSDLNGEQKVTQVLTATNQIRFATALPDGTATGTITVKMAPAGWSKPFSKTNVAVYKSVDPQAHGGGMFLRVDDTSTTIVRVRGYESMTDVDTGIGPFPTVAQQANGMVWVKATTSTPSAARLYLLVADSRTFYIANATNLTGASSPLAVRGFGDSRARRPFGDPFSVFLSGALSASDPNTATGLDTATHLTYKPRPLSGLGSALSVAARNYVGTVNASYSGADGYLGSFPSNVDGSLFVSPRFLADSIGAAPRSDLPGLYTIPQNVSVWAFDNFTTVEGAAGAQGRKLMFVQTAGSNMSSNPAGLCLFDITGPWR